MNRTTRWQQRNRPTGRPEHVHGRAIRVGVGTRAGPAVHHHALVHIAGMLGSVFMPLQARAGALILETWDPRVIPRPCLCAGAAQP
jgi:hypothetical protein